MYKVLLILILFLGAAGSANAQTVTVSQETANKCAKCFDEVAAWREAVQKLEIAKAADAETIKGLGKLVDFYEKTIAIQDQEIVELRKSIRELMEYIIKRPTKKCNGFIVFGC